MNTIAFVPNSNRLLTLGYDGNFRCWDVKTGTEEDKVASIGARHGLSSIDNGGDPEPDYYSALAVSPDGRLAAVPDGNLPASDVQFFDLRQKKLQKTKTEGPIPGGASLAFSSRGDRLACAAGGGVSQWSIAEGKALTPEKSAANPMERRKGIGAYAVTDLRGDDVMATGLWYQTIAFYSAQSGEELGSLRIPRKQLKLEVFRPYQLTLSSDGGILLAVSRGNDISNAWFKPDNMVTLWDMTTGQQVWTFTHDKFHVSQATFSPDGRYVAVGFLNDPAVRLYRIADNKEVAVFQGHTKDVTCIDFSRDGTMIASGSLDHTAIVWNVKDGLLAAAERPKANQDYAKCWDTLKDGKPLKAAEAVASLAAAGDDAVKWLDEKIRPVDKPNGRGVQNLLAQLEDSDPDKRDAAARELRKLGPQIEAAVKKALANKPADIDLKRRLEDLLTDIRSLWVRDPDTVRAVRAVYVLERVASERATALLKKLAAGDPKARLTHEARISLERLEVRKPPKP